MEQELGKEGREEEFSSTGCGSLFSTINGSFGCFSSLRGSMEGADEEDGDEYGPIGDRGIK